MMTMMMMMMNEVSLGWHKVRNARTRNRIKRAHSIVDAEFIVLVGAAVRPSEKHSFQSTAKTGNDGEARTDSDRLFQTDAAAAGKARSPIVARRVRGATSADVLEEHSRRRVLRSETRCRSGGAETLKNSVPLLFFQARDASLNIFG